MYETGMGAAIALPKQTLAQKIAVARAARATIAPSVNFAKLFKAAKKVTPPISVLKMPNIAPIVPVESAMPVSIAPMSAPMSAPISAPMIAPSAGGAAGGASTGSSFPAGDGGDSEGEVSSVASPAFSPMILIAIGAAALFFLGKKGR